MVVAYSQKDKRWKRLKIEPAGLMLKKYGCYVVSIAMVLEKTPDIVLDILNKNKCFTDKGLLLNEKAAQVLDLNYFGVSKIPPKNKPCITETNYFESNGIPQHFFVYLGSAADNLVVKIIDPLSGEEKDNPYHIVSYRLWEKPAPLPPDVVEKKEVIIGGVEVTTYKKISWLERAIAWILKILKKK